MVAAREPIVACDHNDSTFFDDKPCQRLLRNERTHGASRALNTMMCASMGDLIVSPPGGNGRQTDSWSAAQNTSGALAGPTDAQCVASAIGMNGSVCFPLETFSRLSEICRLRAFSAL